MSLHSWITEELKDITFKEKRLKDRFLRIIESFSQRPDCSIPQRSQNWGETKGAYRFFANKNVSTDDFIPAHWKNTAIRAQKEEYVLALHDTSLMSFNGHSPEKNLGRTRGTGTGFFLHTTLIVSPSEQILGTTVANMWQRKDHQEDRSKIISEGDRWVDGITQTNKQLGKELSIINVADREADSINFYKECIANGNHFVVRQRVARRVKNNLCKTSELLQKSNIIGSEDITITNKYHVKRGKSIRVKDSLGRTQRETTLYYQALPIEVKLKSAKEQFSFNMVRIFEKDAIDENEKRNDRIDWYLITSLPINSLEDIKKVAHIYALRWKVELFFKVLKSGCKVQECRLGSFERLQKFISMAMIVSWRICWLKYFGELEPLESAESILSETEILIICKKNKFTGTLTVKQAILWIAKLGGHLNRKNDGDPGFQTLWRGMHRLYDLEEGYLMFQE